MQSTDCAARLSAHFYTHSWCSFARDPALVQWIAHALPAAKNAVQAPQHAHWWRHDNTWFVGVNALDNDDLGCVGQSAPLSGQAVHFIQNTLQIDPISWDRGQVSVLCRGYPGQDGTESAAASRFRRQQYAAHVDGLQRDEHQRRHLNEPHAFILGIPMVPYSAQHAPLVVWEGSHTLVQAALKERLMSIDPALWHTQDVTDTYRQARQAAFARCNMRQLVVEPGAAYLLHRLAVHGTLPWQDEHDLPHGRMICYFRPLLHQIADWLIQP